MSKDAFGGNTKGYVFYARYLPALLTSVPFLILLNFLRIRFADEYMLNYLDIIPYLIQAGLSVAMIFLQIQLNRFVSKELFQRTIFKDELDMPTTRMLLWNNSYFDESTKNMLHKKISEKYDVLLATAEEEKTNEKEARKRASIGVSQIRNSLRGNANFNQHNREYGFVRNLVGGSFVALIVSLVIFIFAVILCDVSLRTLAVIMLVAYLPLVLFCNTLINKYGEYFAKSLFEQFLSL